MPQQQTITSDQNKTTNKKAIRYESLTNLDVGNTIVLVQSTIIAQVSEPDNLRISYKYYVTSYWRYERLVYYLGNVLTKIPTKSKKVR